MRWLDGKETNGCTVFDKTYQHVELSTGRRHLWTKTTNRQMPLTHQPIYHSNTLQRSTARPSNSQPTNMSPQPTSHPPSLPPSLPTLPLNRPSSQPANQPANQSNDEPNRLQPTKLFNYQRQPTNHPTYQLPTNPPSLPPSLPSSQLLTSRRQRITRTAVLASRRTPLFGVPSCIHCSCINAEQTWCQA